MNLSPLRWRRRSGYTFHVVQAEFDEQDIARAQDIADQKVDHVHPNSPAGRIRSREVKHSRITAGKLADAAVQEWLTRAIQQRHRPETFVEYDAVRTDKFENPDPYDFLLQRPTRDAEIEVRSSFSYRLFTPQRIAERLSVYGWYVSASKLVEEHHDFYWQFIFHLRPRDKRRPTNARPPWPDEDRVAIFEDCLERGAVIGYIVGGATREMLEDHTLSAIREDQDGAEYQAIHPVCRAADCERLLDLMFP